MTLEKFLFEIAMKTGQRIPKLANTEVRFHAAIKKDEVPIVNAQLTQKDGKQILTILITGAS